MIARLLDEYRMRRERIDTMAKILMIVGPFRTVAHIIPAPGHVTIIHDGCMMDIRLMGEGRVTVAIRTPSHDRNHTRVSPPIPVDCLSDSVRLFLGSCLRRAGGHGDPCVRRGDGW